MNAAATKFDGKNKYIRITDIDEQSRYKSDSPVSPDGELSDKYRVCKGDILLARTGASTGKSYLYDANDGTLFFAGFLIRCRIKKDYNPYFVFTQTKTENYNRWVVLMSMRSGQPGINSQEYSSYSFKTPSKLEQDKISKLLSLLDSRIQTQNKIIEHLESLMFDFREKLFNRQLRFKNFDGRFYLDWETIKLGDIAEKRITKNVDGKINLVFTNSANQGIVNQRDYFQKDIANQNNLSGYYVVSKDDFVYNPRISTAAPVGPISRNYLETGVMSPLYSVFRITKGDLGYIECFFNSTSWYGHMKKISNSGVRDDRMSFLIHDFYKMPIPFPEIEEQQKIAKSLTKLKEKIETEKKILAAYETQKKYLLQNLFI